MYASIWQLQDIFVDDNCPQSVATGRFKSIAFMRVGCHHCISKSEIINNVISEGATAYFHKGCLLGQKRRQIAEGIVEMFWCKPKISKTLVKGIRSEMEKTVILYNLRGDASNFEKEVKLLLDISNITVFIVNDIKRTDDNKNLKSLFGMIAAKRKKCFIFVYTKNMKIDTIKKTFQEIDRNIKAPLCEIIRLSRDFDVSAVEVAAKYVKPRLEHALSSVQDGVDLHQSMTNNNSISKDHFNNDVVSSLKINSKMSIVPLQGVDLWHKLSHLQQEYLQSQGKSLYEKEALLKVMREIRNRQIETCNKEMVFMAQFLHQLLENDDNETFIQYFLNSTRFILLNEKSRNDLSRGKLIGLNNKMLKPLLSLEHLLREIGQIYEAFSEKKNVKQKTKFIINKLPCLAAKLLLLGHPLEIMDGDAENVPLVWLKRVFEESQILIEKKKIVSIAVIGVQGSGKSTLLNTMFGLQFAVGAGRCTKGIYAQIVPVSGGKFGFDYMFVLDTEGLRSTFISDDSLYKHDNKLALLSMGLADITLVNVKGESTKELKDILEMVMFGLLKLRKEEAFLSKDHTAIFVHQNVSPQSRETIKDESQFFVKTLDEATVTAANFIKIPDTENFSQVINFKPDRDIHCIPDLWSSRLTVNAEYSKSVVEVADTILHCASNFKHALMSDIFQHMRSLWNCISSETSEWNFRSFRQNVADEEMECQLDKQLVNLDVYKEEKLKELKQRILENNEELSLKEHFQESLEKKRIKEEEELLKFIKDNRNSDFIPKDKAVKTIIRKVIEIEKCIEREIHIYEEVITNFLRKFREDTFDKKMREFSEQLTKDNIQIENWNSDILSQFQKFWEESTKAFFEDNDEENKMNIYIEGRLLDIASEKFPKYRDFFQKRVCIPPSEMLQHFTEEGDTCAVSSEINCMLNDFKQNLEDHQQSNTNYEERILIQSLDKISTEFQNRQVSDNFQKDILLFCLQHCYQVFCRMNATFLYSIKKDEHDKLFRTYSKTFKEWFHTYLRQQQKLKRQRTAKTIELKDKSEREKEMQINENEEMDNKRRKVENEVEKATDRGERIAAFLRVSIERNEEEKLKEKIAEGFNKILCTQENRKFTLIRLILKDLAKRGDTQKYKNYIVDPRQYAFVWSSNQVIAFYNTSTASETSSFSSEINENLKIFHEYQNWMKSLEETMEKHGLWTSDIAKLKNESYVPASHMITLKNTFVEELNKSSSSHDERHNIFETEMESYFNNIWGCSHACLWCGEPCKFALDVHSSHQCIQHRPSGICGMIDKQTSKMSIETCNFLVESSSQRVFCGEWCKCSIKDKEISHPCLQYMEYMKDPWFIASMSNHSRSVYWRWVMSTFGNELAKAFGAENPDIPSSWREISKADAEKSLDD
ncbi:interferon-induced very large GTPase 1-like [Saccostrea cucullata]|uniref:interferon-induced very large GTPase 1-like n=1 Tax=Saccostrea cuccullata TaxID=36930 RepID=UPI002ED25760